MPVLKNPHWEKFAQLIAAGAPNKREAFREARGGLLNALRGDKHVLSDTSLSQQASKTLARQDVQERILELQEQVGKDLARFQTTRADQLILEAKTIQAAAFKDKQFNAANAALITRAKLCGLWIEKTETTNAHYAISDKPLSIEEFDAKYINPGPRSTAQH